MFLYDGVLCRVINENERGDKEIEVLEMCPWPNAPEVGSKFWVKSDDKYLPGNEGCEQ